MNQYYIPTSKDPLSCDIFLFEKEDSIYVLDVGNGDIPLSQLKSYLKDKQVHVIISHFHLDHIGNMSQLELDHLYISKQTSKYIKDKPYMLIEQPTTLDFIKIIPIPSSHSKGSLGIVVEDTFYVGDAIYANKGLINVQFLKMQIDLLESLDVSYIWPSHQGYKQEKNEVLNDLKALFSKREKNNPYISVRE